MSWLTRHREASASDLYAEVTATTLTTSLFDNNQCKPQKIEITGIPKQSLSLVRFDTSLAETSSHALGENFQVSVSSDTLESWKFPDHSSPRIRNSRLAESDKSLDKLPHSAATDDWPGSTSISMGIPCDSKTLQDPTSYGVFGGKEIAAQNVNLAIATTGKVFEYTGLAIPIHIKHVPKSQPGVELVGVNLDFSAPLQSIDLEDFRIAPNRFRFEDRKEFASLFAKQKVPGQRTKLPASPRLPPPPEASKQSIQERLRLLLLPPIEELLADSQLCLPEAPFPYQMQGIGWLMQREHALLADEMGLGKTMQAIVAARLLWKQKKVSRILVVCPKTLIGNWRVEIAKWWPQVSSYVKVCDGDRQWFLKLATDNIAIKIINYESLAKEVDWMATNSFSHDMVIIDEAQRIKNQGSDRSRAVKLLKSKYRWALTGTPLENCVEDLVSVFGFVKGDLLSSQNFNNISSKIAPYMLRRRADEVLPQLPARSDVDLEIELLPKQRRAYDRAEREGVIKLNEKGDTATITHVFQLISSLRQICNFEIESGESAKMERLREDLEEIIASERKALVFSQFTEDRGLMKIAEELDDLGPLSLYGRVPSARRDGMVAEFNQNANKRVLLLNYAVGGVGLNLQAAQYVYLFDRWWNPAVEDQAVKRAHRLGQKDRVFVFRFVCKDTIEERIVKKLAEKRALFEAVIEGISDERKIGLTEDEILGLFPGLTIRSKSAKSEHAIPRLVMDNLDPKQFELLVSKIYEAEGYTVKHTGQSSDGGIDLVAEQMGRELVIVQCKRWSASVGPDVVRELWGTMHGNQRITRGDLVTSSTITAKAREFAADKRINLIDGKLLRTLAKKHQIAEFAD